MIDLTWHETRWVSVDENTLEIWSNAQMVALGFPGTMYCEISGF